jgi:hypothetical protein
LRSLVLKLPGTFLYRLHFHFAAKEAGCRILEYATAFTPINLQLPQNRKRKSMVYYRSKRSILPLMQAAEGTEIR